MTKEFTCDLLAVRQPLLLRMATSLGKILIGMCLIVVLAGCSDMSAPPTPEIDKGVNWALSALIDWNYRDRNLFDSYKITNVYTEDRNGVTAHVYDFDADCLVRQIFHVNQAGSTAAWTQALPNGDKFTSGKIEKFKGTFTLVQKGNTWYRQETVR